MKKLFLLPGVLRVLGSVIGFKAVVEGLGFVFEAEQYTRTLLFRHIDAMPIIEPVAFGIALTLAGLVLIIANAIGKKEYVKYSSQALFLVYTFMLVLYMTTGLFLYASSIALPWVLFIMFVSLAYYYAPTAEEEHAWWNS